MPGAEFIDTSATPFVYWRTVEANWNSGEDLVIIEQDVELQPGVMNSFQECDQDWCAIPYEVKTRDGIESVAIGALGCTRFSAKIQSEVRTRHIVRGDCHWSQDAYKVNTAMRWGGYKLHMHNDIFLRHHNARSSGDYIYPMDW